jgi:NAD(P)-dependent dehydrogenase (short-subunit alcohol dehydrogenase family)
MEPGIEKYSLRQNTLNGETVIITGAGGGIGYEAARSLLWLGANVVIAEINLQFCTRAETSLKELYGEKHILTINCDVGNESSIQDLYTKSIRKFGKVDAIINNATIAVLGQVKDLPIAEWDRSYSVNLRGPVLMARTFLPGMIERDHGVFVCVSSTGTSFLGGYETFKAAQVHLANTLDAELEGTNVYAFTIGPGLVPTDTAQKAVNALAPLMGMGVDEFFEMNKGAILSIEDAGVGFALSVVHAEKYRGKEISSFQVLKEFEQSSGAAPSGVGLMQLNPDELQKAHVFCRAVYCTLKDQSEGWKKRSLFQRQWVIRDFKQTAGMPVDEWLFALDRMEKSLNGKDLIERPPLEKLAGYYEHLAELAEGYEKDPIKLEDSLNQIYAWRDEVGQLEKLIRL